MQATLIESQKIVILFLPNQKMIFTLVFLCLTVTVTLGAKGKAPCEKDTFEGCANRLIMISDETFRFPTTIEQMSRRCKEVKALEKCTKDYALNCLSVASKNSISVFLFSMTKMNKSYCTSTGRKQLFASLGDCLNRHKKRLATTFMNGMSRDFHGIKGFSNPKLRIPLACCAFVKAKAGALSYLTGKCSNEEVENIESLIDGYATDILALLCSDWTEDSDKCKRIIDKVPKWRRPLKTKVFLLPLVEILDSLDEHGQEA